MTAREFFLTNKAFETMPPDLRELILKSLEGVEGSPRSLVKSLIETQMRHGEKGTNKNFIMGVLVGFAAADSKFYLDKEK